MKSLRLSALAAALVLAACTTSTPTDPAAAGTRASFDEGPGMVGSGNSATQNDDGGNSLGSGNTAQNTASGDSTGRGGNTLGSGN